MSPDGESGDQSPAWPPPEPPAAPPAPAPPAAPPPPAYGSPSSPYYGRYGQGFSDPPAPPPVAPWTRPAGFHRCGGLGLVALILAGLFVACTWLSVAISFDTQHVIEAATAGSRSAARAYDGYVTIILLRFPVLVAGWIVTSRWLSAVQQNALVLAPSGQRRAPVWAWLGWVMPVVSLWFPKLILDDSIRATAPVDGRPAPRTGAYWGAWLAMLILQNLQFQGLGQDAASSSISPARDVAVAVVATVALALWIVLVRRVSAIQDALAGGS